MILHVAICDDEEQMCTYLEDSLRKILNLMNVNHVIDVYYSGERLCGELKESMVYDLIFLDIEFTKSQINGVEVGNQIRNVYKQNTVSIVYISWEMKYSMQLFEIRPLNFLIKPLEFEKIEQVVKTHLQLSGHHAEDFVYKIRHETFKIKLNNIMFLESINRKIIIHLADGKKEMFYGILKDIYLEQLQKFNFLQIHASYVVNYDHISSMSRTHIHIGSGEITLPISKQKKKEVDEAYFAILERRGVV